MGNCSSKVGCGGGAEDVSTLSLRDFNTIERQIIRDLEQQTIEQQLEEEEHFKELSRSRSRSVERPFYQKRKDKLEEKMNLNKQDFSYAGISKGKRVEIIADGRRGVVSFIGNIDYNNKTEDEAVVGIFLDPEFPGDSNGTYREKEYFKVEQNRGIFIPISGVRLEVETPIPEDMETYFRNETKALELELEKKN